MTSKPAPVLPARVKALVEPLPEQLHAARGEEGRNPAVGDLRGQGDVLWPDRRQVNGNFGSPVEDGLERLAETGRVRARVRNLVVLAAVLERLLASEDRPDDLDVLARAPERFAEGLPCQPSTTWGPETPSPRRNRPPESASRVIAVIAVAAGVRPPSA